MKANQNTLNDSVGSLHGSPNLTARHATVCVVLAKVEMTGIRETGEFERFDGVNWRPVTESAPQAKALVWMNEGTRSDISNAREFARSEGYSVLTFPCDEADPLGQARVAIMSLFKGNAPSNT